MARRFLQSCIILAPVVLFVWLLHQDINPSGVFEVRTEVGSLSPYIDQLLPAERVSSVQKSSVGNFMTITDEPVYVSAHAPLTTYEEVEIELVFRSNGQSLIEFGPRIDVVAQAYDLEPAWHEVIESSQWHRVQEDGVTLLERNGTSPSVTAFLQNPPPIDQIATYAYEFEEPYRLRGYTPLGHVQSVDVSLRGFHKYVTYIKQEPLFLEATFMDMNRTVGADEVVLRVLNETGDVVFEESYGDDVNKTDNQVGSTRNVSIQVADLPEGVYTVELSGTSDIFWRRFETSQRYMTFVNQLFIGDDVGYLAVPRQTTFFTNAKDVAMETFHADATKQVHLGSTEVNIPRSHEKIHTSVTQEGVLRSSTPSGDVKIVGDGKFAFRRDAFFEPDPVKLGALTDVDVRNVDYILTRYTSPTVDADGWSHATATFDLDKIVDENGAMTFTISTPFIASQQAEVDVHEVIIRFKKEALSRSGVWRALRERLPFGL